MRLLACLTLVILGTPPARADVTAPPPASAVASTATAAGDALALTRAWLAAMKTGDAAAFARAVQPPLRIASDFDTCFPAQPHRLVFEQTLSDAAARDRWFQCMIADGKDSHVGFPSILSYARPHSEVVKPRKLSEELRDVVERVARVERGATVVETSVVGDGEVALVATIVDPADATGPARIVRIAITGYSYE